MRSVARVLVAVLVAAGFTLIALPGAGADDAEDVLERARNATVREDFSGLVQIEWLSKGRWYTAQVPVSGTGGTVQVGEGTRRAESRGDDRWIAGVSGWQAGWDEPVEGDVPSPSEHWKLTVAKGDPVAGRSTLVVTATDPDTRRARLRVYTDRDTGIMLRREVLDSRAEVVRAVGFVDVKKLGGSRSTPPPTPKAKDRTPASVNEVPDGFSAPSRIDDRYVLVGRYLRGDDTVQLYYSDGLFGISVFEQVGELDWDGLPRGGDAVALASTDGRAYEVAGGTVVVWERDGMTRTVVSDATVDDLRTFAVAFDARTKDGGGGVVDEVIDFVLGPFGFD